MPSDQQLAEYHALAMRDHVAPRSVALMFADPDDPKVPRLENGSGTCIEIGGRYLVATAAHNLDDVKEYREIGVGALGFFGGFSQQTPKVINHGRRGGENDPLDIAWLEIHPGAVPFWESIWKRKFVTLDRVRLDPVPVLVNAFVFGQPSIEVKVQRSSPDAPPAVGLAPLPYLTKTVESDNPMLSLCVEYPLEMMTAEGIKPTPDPKGISGGGIWLVNAGTDGIWSPDQAQLAAVERSWSKKGRFLRGNLMGEWLRMVREDIPDLATFIDPYLTGSKR